MCCVVALVFANSFFNLIFSGEVFRQSLTEALHLAPPENYHFQHSAFVSDADAAPSSQMGLAGEQVASLLASMVAAQTQLTTQLAQNQAMTQSLVNALGLRFAVFFFPFLVSSYFLFFV